MKEIRERIQALATAQDSINVAIATELESENLAPNTADDISARYWLMNLLEPLTRKELKSIVDGFLVPMLNDEQAKKIVKFLLVRFPHYYKEITEPAPATPVAPQNQPQQVEIPTNVAASSNVAVSIREELMNQDSLEQILESDDKFKYQMLSRMQQDCKYYLGNGEKNSRHLWALDPKKHIAYMKAIWNNLKEKPQWLSMKEIEEYEKGFLS